MKHPKRCWAQERICQTSVEGHFQVIQGLEKFGYLFMHTLERTERVDTLKGLYCREKGPSMCGWDRFCGFHGYINPSRIPVEPKKILRQISIWFLSILCQYTCACDSYMILENLVNTNMVINSLLGGLSIGIADC